MENELYSLDENELEQLRKKLKKEYGVEKLKVFSSSVLMGELVLAVKEFYQNGDSVANITGINLEGQKELGAIFAIISFVIVIDKMALPVFSLTNKNPSSFALPMVFLMILERYILIYVRTSLKSALLTGTYL